MSAGTMAGQRYPLVPGYPLTLSMAGRRAVVVGGGQVALRRVRGLLEAGAEVVVVAPEVAPEFAALPVTVLRRRYRDGDLRTAWVVHAATSDSLVNAQVAAEAEQNRIWCVQAGDAAASPAWTPAVTRHGDLTIAVTAGGDPRRAQRLRAAIAAALASGSLPVRRQRPASNPGPSPAPQPAPSPAPIPFPQQAPNPAPQPAPSPAPIPFPQQAPNPAPQPAPSPAPIPFPQQAPNPAPQPAPSPAPIPFPQQAPNPAEVAGSVALVGGGPGDPGLITVLGRRLLAEADVVVSDKLAPRALLAELDPEVEVIDAGKRPHAHNLSQAEINELIVARALAGQRVVRLKGGDPFVFGRGGEEAVACVRAGVPFQVVPGVTSAVAVPAYAGIPVTHRGVTQDFAVVSAHLDPSHPGATLDWESLARGPGTLVLLMAVAQLDRVAAELVKRGRDAATPVAVISDGTTAEQKVLTSTLGDVAIEAQRAQVRPPAVVVVGEVVRLRELLAPLIQTPGVGSRAGTTANRRIARVTPDDRESSEPEPPVVEATVSEATVSEATA
jgi:uroporphyrin-III C-methyltransferase / precorrin-2 dehydrogenase / sirohydrochlorin ferrochelatase